MRMLAFVASIALATGLSAHVQTVRAVDPTPLQRPKPVCSLAGTEIRAASLVVKGVLERAGFTVNAVGADGEISATLSSPDGENRIVTWLEWEITRPQERFNVFMVSGRFEKFVGSVDLRRVLLSSREEEQHFGAVRKALIEESLKRQQR
ncbi:MAG TPA: hypothetical protein VFV98_14750 [Vicinamibacterales bacterium]|nr:hypothetical protein [Vicinamibacterales bacterium]